MRDFSRLEGARGGASSEVVKLQTETGTKYFKREDSIDLDEVRDETDKPLAIAKKEMFEKFGNVPEADVSLLPDLLTLPDRDSTFQDVSEEGRPAITYNRQIDSRKSDGSGRGNRVRQCLGRFDKWKGNLQLSEGCDKPSGARCLVWAVGSTWGKYDVQGREWKYHRRSGE